MKTVYAGVLVLSLAGGLTTGGCSGPAVNTNAKTTFLDSNDMVKMTDQMAESIMSSPDVQREMAKGPLKIVVKPVENQTNEIIRDNRKELFVQRLAGLLGQNAALRDKFVWLLNKEDYDKLRAEEIPESQLAPVETRILPEYALYAVFLADTNVTATKRRDVYLCQYKLTRLSGSGEGVILWTGQYETSKHIKKDLLD
jgi:Peptidoglycan-synthase activator LpoB